MKKAGVGSKIDSEFVGRQLNAKIEMVVSPQYTDITVMIKFI